MMTRRAGEDEPARWVEPGQTLRAGELTAVWAPDDRHEAMRDLSRARLAAKKDLQGKRQQIISLMLRLGRIYPGKKTWGPAHMDWLMRQKLGHGEQRIAFEELMEAVRQESERVTRLEEAIREAVPERSLAEVVTALQAMRGIDLIAAVAVLAELGDLTRFQNPRELMGYLSLVPSENSTGDRLERGGITKAGNGRARRILVEAAWAYRHPARAGREKQAKVAAAPRRVREIDARPKTGAAPDEQTEIAVANPRIRVCSPTSSGPRPLLCTIHAVSNFTRVRVERGYRVRCA